MKTRVLLSFSVMGEEDSEVSITLNCREYCNCWNRAELSSSGGQKHSGKHLKAKKNHIWVRIQLCSPGCGLCAPRVHVAGTDASSLLLAASPRCLFPRTRYWVNLALALEQKEPVHIKCLFVQMKCGVCVFVLRVSRVFKSLGATLSCPGVKPKHISRGAIRSLITPLHRSLCLFQLTLLCFTQHFTPSSFIP